MVRAPAAAPRFSTTPSLAAEGAPERDGGVPSSNGLGCTSCAYLGRAPLRRTRLRAGFSASQLFSQVRRRSRVHLRAAGMRAAERRCVPAVTRQACCQAQQQHAHTPCSGTSAAAAPPPAAPAPDAQAQRCSAVLDAVARALAAQTGSDSTPHTTRAAAADALVRSPPSSPHLTATAGHLLHVRRRDLPPRPHRLWRPRGGPDHQGDQEHRAQVRCGVPVSALPSHVRSAHKAAAARWSQARRGSSPWCALPALQDAHCFVAHGHGH